MISGVVAKLDPETASIQRLVSEISSHPKIGLGELIDGRSLPMTLEAEDELEMENTTRWLQGRDGIELVDVVFVQFEDV